MRCRSCFCLFILRVIPLTTGLLPALFETFDELDDKRGMDVPLCYQSAKFMNRKRGAESEVAFTFMASRLLPIVAGLKYWGKQMFHQCLSHGSPTDCNGLPLVSVSDEGLTLFFLRDLL